MHDTSETVSDIRYQRIAHRELDLLFEDEDVLRRREQLAMARTLAHGDEALLEAVRWLELLTQVGCHPSYVLQSWASIRIQNRP